MEVTMKVSLHLYAPQLQGKAIKLIKRFWKEHNDEDLTDDDAMADLGQWINEGNKFYFINYNGEIAGFAHLGSRGGTVDWLEHLFVEPEYQRRGIAGETITLLEEIVKEYSMSLYLEVAARNLEALKLYQRLGYDTLNTVTIRKDLSGTFEVIERAQIAGHELKIKKLKPSDI